MMEFIWWKDTFKVYLVIILKKYIHEKFFTIQSTKFSPMKLIRYTVATPQKTYGKFCQSITLL